MKKLPIIVILVSTLAIIVVTVYLLITDTKPKKERVTPPASVSTTTNLFNDNQSKINPELQSIQQLNEEWHEEWYDDSNLQTEPDISEPVTEIEPDIPKPVGWFDLDKAKVGDNVSGLQIIGIDPYRIKEPIAEDNVTIQFSGEIILKGIFNPPATELGAGPFNDYACFFPSPESQQKLPQYIEDGIWFCFENSNEAIQILGTAQKETTIIIDDYRMRSYGTEIWDTATFIKEIKL